MADALAVAANDDTIRINGSSSITATTEKPRITTALRLVSSGGSVRIGVLLAPQLAGLTQSEAEQAILDAGFSVGTITEAYSNDVSAGQVISQNPVPGTGLAPGTAIDMVISKGPELIASFTVRTPGSHVPLLAAFEDTTPIDEDDPVTTWHWAFGDGNTSTKPAPVHHYLVPGDYTPTLTVTTVAGRTASVTLDPAIAVNEGADEDGDGIAGLDEIDLGTDPGLWDTDGDSFGDGDEWRVEMDPTTADAQIGAQTLALDGNPDWQILGLDGDQLILFYTGPPAKSGGVTVGTKLVTGSAIPVATTAKGAKSFTSDALGFLGEVTGVASEAIAQGQAVVVNGVIYMDEAAQSGVVYALTVVTNPITAVFPEFEADWTTRFGFNTDDPELFPGGSPLRGRELYNANGLVVKITDGIIAFSPDLHIYLLVQGGELADAVFTTTGVFYINLDVEATVSQSYSYDSGDVLLAKAVIPIANLPIKVDLELNAQLLADFNATATATAGFDSKTTVTVGGRYYLDEMHNLSSILLSNNLHTPTLTMEGDAVATLILKPKLDVNLYEQAGAYLELRPYARLAGYYPCPPKPSYQVGIDAEVGVYTSFFGLLETNPSITWPDPPLTYTLWTPETCGFLGTPPTAQFTATPTTGSSPLTVQFTDQSTPGSASGITKWRWSFGDGATSYSRNPSHTYASHGTYNVALTVESDSGTETLTRQGYIAVGQSTQRPVASFAASPRYGTAPLSVQFTDLTDPGTAPITWWGWDFDNDGTVDSNAQNPVHTYDSPGTYSVRLQVASAHGNDAYTSYSLIRGSESSSGQTETIMLPGDVPLEMVWIEPGTFMMGRYQDEQDSDSVEDPQHQVTLTQGFWMGKYELTKAQWTAVMGTTPWSGLSYVLNDPDSPAVYISWNDAQAFIAALNSLTGATFRLPSEAEWEYACRAGTTTRFYWGDDPGYTVGNDYEWWKYNAWDYNKRYAHVVGEKLPNAWGLYDMSGNVREWCQDRYALYESGSVTDPTGPTLGSDRVVRGGAWGYFGNSCRSAVRGNNLPSHSQNNVGFRLAR